MLMKSQYGKFYLDFSMHVILVLGVMNGDFQSDLATLTFKNGEQLEDFHSRIIRLQQKIILSGETVSPKNILFWYMK